MGSTSPGEKITRRILKGRSNHAIRRALRRSILNTSILMPDLQSSGHVSRHLHRSPEQKTVQDSQDTGVQRLAGQASPLSNIDQTVSGLIRHTVTVNLRWCSAAPEITILHTLTREVSVRTFTIVAMAFLFVFVGMPRMAQADEVKAKME